MPHDFSVPHPHAALFEMGHDSKAMVADLEDDVVAIRWGDPGLADGFVGVNIADADDPAVCRGQHGLAEAVPGLNAPGVTVVASPVDDSRAFLT